jgi:hypothetical protein
MRTSRWTSAIVGLSAVSLAACSSDRSSGIASTENAAPEVFSVGAAAVSGALKATNQKVKLFETIPRLEARMQRAGIRQNLVNSPYDLTYNGGPVVTHSAEWNVYINCPSAPSCWSTGKLTPAVFMRDFDRSSMIQIANQYLHEDAFGRFRQVNELATSFTFAVDTTDNTPTATGNDIVSILVGAVNFTGQVGYTNEYHLFFPQGTNVCTGPTNCYSPSNPSTFVFCAFHGSIDLGPNAHVLFSVEPYQATPGCQLPQQTRVIDATASTLSHEFTETITDPDGDAWFNDLTGNEISDLCFTFRNPEQVNSRMYVIQEEYSNTVHACTDGAF